MRELTLCGTRLAPAAIASLDRAISVGGPLFRLQRLSLASCRLGDAGARRLGLALRYCPALAALDLSHNQIGPGGAAMVAGLLIPEGGQLATLELGKLGGAGGGARATLTGGEAGGGDGGGEASGVGDDGGVDGGNGVVAPASACSGADMVDGLEVDSLSAMEVENTLVLPAEPLAHDSAPAQDSASALDSARGGTSGGGDGVGAQSRGGWGERVSSHRLSSCGLGASHRPSGAASPPPDILDTTPSPPPPHSRPKLRVLDLSCNPLGDKGVESIALALRRNTTLRQLTLRYVNANPPEGNARLDPVPMLPLLSATQLTCLELSHNFLSASAAEVDQIKDVRRPSHPSRSH
jgi:hypothetical protein